MGPRSTEPTLEAEGNSSRDAETRGRTKTSECKDSVKQVLFLSEVHVSPVLDLTTVDLTSGTIDGVLNFTDPDTQISCECSQNWEQDVTVPPD